MAKSKKSGTVLENNLWKLKVYSPPREHGSPHVHVISKGDKAELKLYLETLEMAGKAKFSRKAVKEIVRYVHQNYDLLMNCWEDLHGKKKKTKS